MSFYEELGVPQDASPDTIREAYRNVARVLHPDAQINPVLKACAEVQMKRVNRLHDILSDPELRKKYDEELAAAQARPTPVIIQALAPVERHSRNWTWVAAVAVCAISVFWLATRDSTPPAAYPPVAMATLEEAKPVASGKKAPADRVRDAEIARLRGQLAAVSAERDRLLQRRFQLPTSGAREVQTPQPSVLTPAALAPAVAPVELGVPVLRPVAPPSRWAGSWIYNSRTENKNTTLVPPEYIETVIRDNAGELQGRYHGRFKVADARIAPEVDFQFHGKIAGMSGRFAWTGPGGAKGEVQLRLVSDSSLEVVWSASDLGRSMGLASGTAVLSRRN